jgi:hypothetical protein
MLTTYGEVVEGLFGSVVSMVMVMAVMYSPIARVMAVLVR